MSDHVDYAYDKFRLLMLVREPDMMEHFVRRLKRMLGPGKHLEQAIRSRMEAFLGYDLSHVRVHSTKQAARLAKKLGAEAFTVQSHIFGPPEKFNMQTPKGAGLLAHEITHVIQHTQPRRLSEQERSTRVLTPQWKPPMVAPTRGTALMVDANSGSRSTANEHLSRIGRAKNHRESCQVTGRVPPTQLSLKASGNIVQREKELEALANEDSVRSILANERTGGSHINQKEISPDDVAARVYRLMQNDLIAERERGAHLIIRR